MRRARSWIARAVTAAALAPWLALPLSGQVLVPEGRDFRNGASAPLAAHPDVEALLDQLEHALAVTDPEEAAFVVRGLRQRGTPELVEHGPRTWVPALERAAARVMASESDALRARVLDEQRALLDARLAERDVDGLLELATRGTAFPTAREAARHAARFLFEQGRWWAAAVFARRGGAPDLARHAEARRAPSSAPEPWPGPWHFGFTHRYVATRIASSGAPFARDGAPGEVLIADDDGLRGFDLRDVEHGPRRARDDFPYAGGVLGLAGRSVLPAPRAHELRGPLTHLVQSFDLPLSPDWRSPVAEREARLLSLDASGARAQRNWMRRIAPWVERGVSSASGTPLVLDDRVVALSFAQELVSEAHLVALDRDDGELLYDTPLVAAPVVPRFASRQAQSDARDLDKRGDAAELLELDGVIYAATGRGALAAVDALTGWPRFVFRYDRLFSLDPGLYDRRYLFDTGGWDDEPPRAAAGRVILAPSDSRYLYSLAPEPSAEGYLIREDPIERLGRRHVVALRPDPRGGEAPAILLTERVARRWGLVLLGADGAVLARSARLPLHEEVVARPAVTATHVLLPVRSGVCVWPLDELHEAPTLLSLPARVPPLARVTPLADGLLGLCPDDERPGGVVELVWWPASRPEEPDTPR